MRDLDTEILVRSIGTAIMVDVAYHCSSNRDGEDIIGLAAISFLSKTPDREYDYICVETDA